MALRKLRLDSRRKTLILALGLLLAAILVAAALLQQSTSTKVYLVANHDLTPGVAITSQDVRPAELNLGAEAGTYLSSLGSDLTLGSPVLAGELIPRKATLSRIATTTKSVRITPSEPLSIRIRVGSRVQLWFVPKQTGVEIVGNAVQLLSDTQVLAIHKGENSLGKQIDDVELAVATENLTAVITAIASAGYVSIIAES